MVCMWMYMHDGVLQHHTIMYNTS